MQTYEERGAGWAGDYTCEVHSQGTVGRTAMALKLRNLTYHHCTPAPHTVPFTSCMPTSTHNTCSPSFWVKGSPWNFPESHTGYSHHSHPEIPSMMPGPLQLHSLASRWTSRVIVCQSHPQRHPLHMEKLYGCILAAQNLKNTRHVPTWCKLSTAIFTVFWKFSEDSQPACY